MRVFTRSCVIFEPFGNVARAEAARFSRPPPTSILGQANRLAFVSLIFPLTSAEHVQWLNFDSNRLSMSISGMPAQDLMPPFSTAIPGSRRRPSIATDRLCRPVSRSI